MSLDPARFERELTGHVYAGRINEDVQSGLKSGVQGTPTYFVGGIRYEGSHDLDSLRAAIEEADRS